MAKKKRHKRTNNDLQNTTHKSKDRVTPTPYMSYVASSTAPHIMEVQLINLSVDSHVHFVYYFFNAYVSSSILVLNALVYKNGAHPDICEKWHILLTCGENVHERIIILRREILAHKTSLTLPLFIKVSVLSQECQRSCASVFGVSILSLSAIFLLDFGTVPWMNWSVNELFREWTGPWMCYVLFYILL